MLDSVFPKDKSGTRHPYDTCVTCVDAQVVTILQSKSSRGSFFFEG